MAKPNRSGKYDVAAVFPAACRKCGSTEREPYHGTKHLDITGISPDGDAYNRITIRRTKCANCGQHRAEKSYETLIQDPPTRKRGRPKRASKPAPAPDESAKTIPHRGIPAPANA